MGDDVGRQEFFGYIQSELKWHRCCRHRFWDNVCIDNWSLKIGYISNAENMENVSSVQFKLLTDFYKHRVELVFMNISPNMPDELRTEVGLRILFWWHRCYCVVDKNRVNIVNQWNGIYPEPYYHHNWIISRAKSLMWFRW